MVIGVSTCMIMRVVQPNCLDSCLNGPNSNINVSLMWTQVRAIFTVPNQFYLHKKF